MPINIISNWFRKDTESPVVSGDEINKRINRNDDLLGKYRDLINYYQSLYNQIPKPLESYDHTEAYNGVLKRRIEYIADRVATAQLRIKYEDGSEYERPEKLVRSVQSLRKNYYRMMFNLVVDLLSEGNHYWIIPGTKTDRFNGFIPVPAIGMYCSWNKDKNALVYSLSNARRYHNEFDADVLLSSNVTYFTSMKISITQDGHFPSSENWRIIHFKYGESKENPNMGIGLLESAKQLIRMKMKINHIRDQILDKGGYIPLVFFRDSSAMLGEDLTASRHEVASQINKMADEDRENGIWIPEGWTADNKLPAYKDIMNLDLEKILDEQLTEITGVHPSLLSSSQDSASLDMDSIKRNLQENTLKPLLRNIGYTLDESVWKIILNSEATTEYEIPEMARDETLFQKKYISMYENNLICRDEAREKIDSLPPIDSAPKYNIDFEKELEEQKAQALADKLSQGSTPRTKVRSLSLTPLELQR